MDPLFITAGAAGFISLGLRISSGLIRFCRDYRHREVDSIARHVAHFEAVLVTLNQRLHNADPALENAVRQYAVASDRCQLEMKQLVARYSSKPARGGVVSRGKAAMLKLQYPFDTGKLDDIKVQLRHFQADVSGVLLLLNLYIPELTSP